jgi:competence protein ComGC
MKKKLLILLIIIIVIIISILVLPTITNNHYQNNTIKELEQNTNLKVEYLNQYNNYYIVKTNDKIIVFNTKYEKITEETLDKIATMDYDIIYKSNTLMYEETLITKGNITYNYYDIHTQEKINTIEIEA